MQLARFGLSPGMCALEAIERAERGSLEFGFARQPCASPARECRRLGLAHVHRPRGGKRNPVEHSAPPPLPADLRPEQRVRQLSALDPCPILRSPPPWITIATGVDELLIARIRDVLRLNRKSRDVYRIRRMLVVPSKRNCFTVDAERCAPCRQTDPLRVRRRALRDRGVTTRAVFLFVRKPVPHIEERFLMHRLMLQNREDRFGTVEEWIARTIQILVRQRV